MSSVYFRKYLNVIGYPLKGANVSNCHILCGFRINTMTPIQLCCVSDLVVEASLGLDMLIHTRVIVIIQYASTVSNE